MFSTVPSIYCIFQLYFQQEASGFAISMLGCGNKSGNRQGQLKVILWSTWYKQPRGRFVHTGALTIQKNKKYYYKSKDSWSGAGVTTFPYPTASVPDQ